jgi:hypothetical protein
MTTVITRIKSSTEKATDAATTVCDPPNAGDSMNDNILPIFRLEFLELYCEPNVGIECENS